MSISTGRTPFRVASLALVAGWLGVVACAKKEAPAVDTAAMAAPAAAPAITDAQIAHIVVTANSIDSSAGELAKTKGTAKSVKDFAQMMITDHGGVNKKAVALATSLNLTPEDNDTSRQFKTAADQSMTTLNGLSGAAFDKAYIDHEVTYHQTVLDALDQTLLPGTQNAELKSLLESSRPAFAAHLERAKTIQGTLGK